jgi:ATP-dependent Clp protease ATP-binding subunit ClpA
LPEGQRIEHLAGQAAQALTPFEALRSAGELRRELDDFERQQVALALAEGATFAQIARHLGLSRQAVHRRFRSVNAAELPATSSAARRLLRLAREAAAAFGPGAPRSEHVLLAALRAPDLPAAAVLREAGATLEQTGRMLQAANPKSALFRLGAAEGDLRTVLAAAAGEARRRGNREIEAEHLLLGALKDDDGGAARMLRALGIDVDAVRGGLAGLLAPQPKT